MTCMVIDLSACKFHSLGSEMIPSSIAVICLSWLVQYAQPIGIPGVIEVGPADIVVTLTEDCRFTLPSFVEFSMKLVRLRGNKQSMNVSATLPFKLSDKLGIEISIAQKKAGQWRPNFFKAKASGVCSAVKNAEKDIFAIVGKDLNAPEPYTCPLPAGKFAIIDYPLNLKKFQKQFGGESLPYGDFKAQMNITHKSEVIGCVSFYYETVPRQDHKKG